MPEAGEDLAVALAGHEAERRRGRDDDDDAVGAAREVAEPVQDDPIADLVLGPADDHDASRRSRRGRCVLGGTLRGSLPNATGVVAPTKVRRAESR